MVAQELLPLVRAERVRRFAERETLICLAPPPFRTIAEEPALGLDYESWEGLWALDQIDPGRALVIADFGLGADSPVILDFARDPGNPPVLCLRWRTPGGGNEWVQGARDFDEFAALLGRE